MRKRVMKIPRRISIKCPHCEIKTRLEVNPENNIYKLDCPKCKEIIATPINQCCLICAFSNKKCPDSLRRQAIVKGLTIK